ncbi:MAG TPA: hypothetical protein VF252_12745 [Gemmatimonadales bacterium]
MRSALMLTAALVWAPQQDWVVAYAPQQLQCARYLEDGKSSIQTETDGRIRNQTSERRGYWQFRASRSDAGIALEAWLDSLTLTRRSPELTLSPDTDGLLGGRYRGVLSRTGAYRSEVQPFIPDEVAEVAGMGTALDDFFPPLPPLPLEVGKSWTDSAGLTIRRLRDSSLSGLPLFRFELHRKAETRVSAATRGDSLAVPHRQVSEESGSFVWHPTLGILRRDRRIVVQTAVLVSRTVRRPIRSRLEQRVVVHRDLRGDPTECRNGGTRERGNE